MSTIAKSMALACGVALDKPFIFEQFYPLEWPLDKVILLHAGGGERNEKNEPLRPTKLYDYYNEVVALLRPQIEKLGYRIYQIGGEKEIPINGTVSLLGLTTIKQSAYLLKNCALFFGNDSINAHIAGSYGIPMVILFGSTDAKNHGPEWCNKDKTVFIESHRFGEKRPSYSNYEPEKTINVILPESVTTSILKLLNLEEIKRESIFIGKNYNNQILEIVPDNILRPDFFPNLGIHVRMDYLWNDKGLIANLQQRHCGIFTDKPFDIEILKKYRQNVDFCRIKISPDITPQFIKQIIRLGIPYSVSTEEKDLVKLKELRYEFFDVAMMDNIEGTKIEDFWSGVDRYLNKKIDRNLNLKEYLYKSNRYIISKSGIFLSHAAFLKNDRVESLQTNSQSVEKYIDDEIFWKDLQFFYIYR